MTAPRSLRRFAFAVALLAGCGAGTSAPVQPDVPAPPTATPSPAPAPAPAPTDPLAWTGWWRSDVACLELFDNGDFELSLPSADPKVMAFGAAAITKTDDGAELRLTTARIWKGRYTGPCRKVHELGGWIDAQDVLGVGLRPGEPSTFKLRRIDADQLELCGLRCTTLRRDTPQLVARWRREKMDFPDRPEAPWSAGDLLELAISDSLDHAWFGLAGGKFLTVYGELTARHVGPDRFSLTFVGERLADGPADGPPTALGLVFPLGEARTLTARRLAGERLEVCGAEGRCAVLAREFDAYHHDLD